MLRTLDIDLVYQNLIDGPPAAPQKLYEKACSSDGATVGAWREIWIKNAKLNKEKFGRFADKTIGKLHGINRGKAAIICGSGPSLKQSIEGLRENKQSAHPLMVVSCLHNFGYFEDENVHADYYLSLDSGDIIMSDVFEGRKYPQEHYWEASKGKTLLATVMTPPKLFELWQGEIVLFSTMMPDAQLQRDLQAVERFSHYVSCGGNALGGCLYVAKAIFGSETLMICGADFCFDYDNTFHSYKTHYDAPGGYVMHPDVFGNMRKTWPSYLNFKYWFDWVACTIPGRYINCSEGLMGAYREGNIQQFQYMSLKQALVAYQMADRIYLEHRDENKKVIKKDPISLTELFSNPEYDLDLVVF